MHETCVCFQINYLFIDVLSIMQMQCTWYELGHFKKIPLSTLCYNCLDLELAHGKTFGPTSKVKE